MVEVHPENFKSTRIVATRDSNSIRMEMSRVANVSFITHDDTAATWLPGSHRRRLADAAALLAATAAPHTAHRRAVHLEHCALGGAGSRQLMEIGQGSTTTTHPIIVFPSNKTENCRQNVSD